MIHPPGDETLRAFGVPNSTPRAVQGGQGTTFRVGHLAIKPCEDAEQAEWLGGLMEAVEERDFRIARPVRAESGSFVVDGWCATRWIQGTSALEGHWEEAIEACSAFHYALSEISWSPVLNRSNNPYVLADATIWADPPLGSHPLGVAGERLLSLLRPVIAPSQLVHGDPSEGNILFAVELPPGFIDMAPYWHPAGYPLAVLVADGIAWSGAPLNLLNRILSFPEMDQFLARAVLFRLYVGFLFRRGTPGAEQRARAYAPVIEAIERWTG